MFQILTQKRKINKNANKKWGGEEEVMKVSFLNVLMRMYHQQMNKIYQTRGKYFLCRGTFVSILL